MKLIDVLKTAGWLPSEHGNALGVIDLESGGNPNAHNTAGEDSRGLFQLNVGPGAHTAWADKALYDPLTNARYALLLWQAAEDWRDWWEAAGILGLPPRGDYRHSVEEFAALADREMGDSGDGDGDGDGNQATPSAGAVLLSVGLAVAILTLVID